MADVNFFEVELESGQQISMSINEDVDEFGIWSDNSNDNYWYDLAANETVYFTASADDTYYVYAYCTTDARVRAYMNGYEYKAIDGATDAIYAATEDGLYACEVTFADSTTEMSDCYEGPHAHNYESVVTAPTCTEAGYTTYTCTFCGDEYTADETNVIPHDFVDGTCTVCGEEELTEPEYNYTFSILEPSRTEIRNKDGIKLHANIDGTAPEGVYVEWTANNDKFDTEELNGNILKIIAKNKGYTTFTATLYDADGNELATDSVEMYSKSGFFQKLGGFFRSLFGTTTIYEN